MSDLVVEGMVPVLRVASVARSLAWYADVLGFRGEAVGPPADPLFAILQRDSFEIMLQKLRPGASAARAAGRPEAGWDVYIRVYDVEALRTAVREKAPGAGDIVTREYGCDEFTLADPDGHVLVFGQCG